jgi:hypothetical protein
MWTCPHCGRIFPKAKQPHSCHTVPLEEHFTHKEQAKELFDYLVNQIEATIGKCQKISLPCCVHLFGTYDFLAALPKKEKLEIRFAYNSKLQSPRIKQRVSLSHTTDKICIDIQKKEEIDTELLQWIKEAYRAKN